MYENLSENFLDLFIQETDEKLHHNSYQIEDTLKDLLSLTESLPGSGIGDVNSGVESSCSLGSGAGSGAGAGTNDAKYAESLSSRERRLRVIASLVDSRALESSSCRSNNSDIVSKVLNNALNILKTWAGYEECVYKQIVQLSFNGDIVFPFNSQVDDGDDSISIVSLNTITDDNNRENLELWSKIKMKLKRYFSSRLLNLKCSKVGDHYVDLYKSSIVMKQRKFYTESISLLCNSKDAVQKYIEVRNIQVNGLLGNYVDVPLSLRATLDLLVGTAGAAGAGGVGETMRHMIAEDVVIFSECPVFIETLPSIYQLLCLLYMEPIAELICFVMEHFESQLEGRIVHESNQKMKLSSLDRKKTNSTVGPINDGGKPCFYHLGIFSNYLLEKYASPDQKSNKIQELHIGLFIRIARFCENFEDFIKTHDLQFEGNDSVQHSSLKSVLKPTVVDKHRVSQIIFAKQIHSPNQAHGVALQWQEGFITMASELSFATRQLVNHSFSGELDSLCNGVVDPYDCARVGHAHQPPSVAGWHAPPQTPATAPTAGHAQSAPPPPSPANGRPGSTAADANFTRSRRHSSPSGNLVLPLEAPKSIFHIMQQVDELSVLARISIDQSESLNQLLTSFLEVLKILFHPLENSIIKMLLLPDQKLTPTRLCVSMAICNLIIYKFNDYYNSLVKSSKAKKTLKSLISRFSSHSNELLTRLLDLNESRLTTSVLMDPASVAWSSNTHFHEDERCSFYVQRLHVYLCSLKHNARRFLTPSQGHQCITSALNISLWTLAKRYARVRPSYKRTSQYRNDIHTLLLVASEHIASVRADDDDDGGGGGGGGGGVSINPGLRSLHEACTHLFACLVFVSSPLEHLYRYAKQRPLEANGIPSPAASPTRPISASVDAPLSINDPVTAWSLVFSSFTSDTSRYNSLPLLGEIDVLFSKPFVDYVHLIKILLCNNGQLLKYLMCQVCQYWCPATNVDNVSTRQPQPLSKDLTSGIASMIVNSTQSALLRGCVSSASLFRNHQHDAIAADDVIASLMQAGAALASSCADDNGSSLVALAAAMVHRTDSWNLFDRKHVIADAMPVPPWIQIILNLVAENIDRCVSCLSHLHDESDSVFTDKHLLDNSDLLSCNCKPRILQHQFCIELTEDEKIQRVISELIQQLVSDLSLLPYEFILLSNNFQKVLDSKSIKTPHNCVGLKLLATALRIHINNIYLSTENILFLKLANCIYHLFTSLDSDIISGVLKTASDFMKNNRNWLNEQIKIICEHFENCLTRENTEKLDQVHNSCYEEIKIKILNRENGDSHLSQLYNFTLHNRAWIRHELESGDAVASSSWCSNSSPASPQTLVADCLVDSIATPISSATAGASSSSTSTKNSPPFSLKTQPPTTQDRFEPLKCFKVVGNQTIDHLKINNHQFDWSDLFTKDFGMSNLNIVHLMSHRHEFIDSDYLTDREIKRVNFIKEKFSI